MPPRNGLPTHELLSKWDNVILSAVWEQFARKPFLQALLGEQKTVLEQHLCQWINLRSENQIPKCYLRVEVLPKNMSRELRMGGIGSFSRKVHLYRHSDELGSRIQHEKWWRWWYVIDLIKSASIASVCLDQVCSVSCGQSRLPCSTWPIVPTLTWGFERSNFSLDIFCWLMFSYSENLKWPIPGSCKEMNEFWGKDCGDRGLVSHIPCYIEHTSEETAVVCNVSEGFTRSWLHWISLLPSLEYILLKLPGRTSKWFSNDCSPVPGVDLGLVYSGKARSAYASMAPTSAEAFQLCMNEWPRSLIKITQQMRKAISTVQDLCWHLDELYSVSIYL